MPGGAYPYTYPFLYYLPDRRTFETELSQYRSFKTEVKQYRTFNTTTMQHRELKSKVEQI